MREGATDYIVKPFDAQALIDMAQRQLAARVTPNELVAVDPESKRTGVSRAQDRRERCHGAHHRRKRHRQGGVRALHPRPFGARRQALRRHQLRRDPGEHARGDACSATRRAPSPARSAAHAGKFEQAQGGTLLLDEISEMDLGLQAKILRVLQEREVERLGSTRTISLDVRVIATSNRDLPEEVRAGALPRRSLLPAQRDVAAAAAAARASRRHPAAGAPRHAGLRARRAGRLEPVRATPNTSCCTTTGPAMRAN